jgi:hypothetical protein
VGIEQMPRSLKRWLASCAYFDVQPSSRGRKPGSGGPGSAWQLLAFGIDSAADEGWGGVVGGTFATVGGLANLWLETDTAVDTESDDDQDGPESTDTILEQQASEGQDLMADLDRREVALRSP